jgi:ankyrin repeat protein
MDVVELLKSRGANINESSEAGTPLMIALAVRRQERFAPPDGTFPGEPDLLGVYQAFQRMGADFGVVDGEGNTLFHVAMKSLRRPLIEAMLASGSFDLNLPNKVGDTPFMNFASSAGYTQSADGSSGVTTDLDLIAQLIAKGANNKLLDNVSV